MRMRTRQKDANDDIQCKCIVYELFRPNNTNAEEKDQDDKIDINLKEKNRKIKE